MRTSRHIQMASPATVLPVTAQELVTAYRHLLRHSLRAVQFSKPSRYVIVDQLRAAFRDPKASAATFDRERVRRTIWFFKAATQEAGLESRILKNLVRVHWERKRAGRWSSWKGQIVKAAQQAGKTECPKRTKPTHPIRGTEYTHYENTIAMLNDTMGLCLR
ncbi:hypothetical protein B0T25DRAFT_316477 [Lasiosphaeria hispida]|uniref:DUF1763-domain-containing protein n=1 Tax=Lasiosphaeria hispida TaxID=260671 RepID=A0AAJ0M9Y4_9PEZI|nr:hypothetical protein B0T25DRAFT_316477 [Lasiosphaeria hispida]